MLVEGVGWDGHLDPFAPAGDDRERRRPCVGDPHVVLQLRHVFFRSRFFRERPGQHELGFEHRVGVLDHAVEGCGHPPVDRMLNPALNVADGSSGVALIPGPIQRFGGDAELDDEIVAQILRLGLAALFLPQPDEGRLVGAHNDLSVRTADELAAVFEVPCERLRLHELSPGVKTGSAASDGWSTIRMANTASGLCRFIALTRQNRRSWMR